VVHQTGLIYPPRMTRAAQVVGPPPFVRLAAHPVRWKLLITLADSDYRVRELVGQVDEPQNLVSYHLRLLREEGLVTATRSSFDGRDTYYHLDLDGCADALAETGAALHPVLRAHSSGGTVRETARSPVAVLFVCTGNSVRSPMAAALLHHYAAADRVHVTSAGTRPRPQLHPSTVRVLKKRFGIDVVGRHPRDVATLANRRFDHVITLCDRARETSPEFPQQPRRAHWSVPEPAPGGAEAATDAAFDRTAKDIDARVRHLLPLLTSAR
jgi:protein-tyrosine-phosphatase/DNA-binding transcriptional ArsR family regulator